MAIKSINLDLYSVRRPWYRRRGSYNFNVDSAAGIRGEQTSDFGFKAVSSYRSRGYFGWIRGVTSDLSLKGSISGNIEINAYQGSVVGIAGRGITGDNGSQNLKISVTARSGSAWGAMVGSKNIDLGSGDDVLNINSNGYYASNGIRFHGYYNAGVKLGDGDDQLNINLNRVTSRSRVTGISQYHYAKKGYIDMGDGDDSINITMSGTKVGAAGRSEAVKDTKIFLGAGNDSFSSDDWMTVKNTEIWAGDGDDKVSIHTISQSTVDLGEGNDVFTVGRTERTRNTRYKTGLLVNGGEGVDLVEIKDPFQFGYMQSGVMWQKGLHKDPEAFFTDLFDAKANLSDKAVFKDGTVFQDVEYVKVGDKYIDLNTRSVVSESEYQDALTGEGADDWFEDEWVDEFLEDPGAPTGLQKIKLNYDDSNPRYGTYKSGSSGDDVITGLGGDYLKGGDGEDTFVMTGWGTRSGRGLRRRSGRRWINARHDRILDFNASEDTLALDSQTFANIREGTEVGIFDNRNDWRNQMLGKGADYDLLVYKVSDSRAFIYNNTNGLERGLGTGANAGVIADLRGDLENLSAENFVISEKQSSFI